jgi:photosystem II stability/assembly factor-like uncharacterized protein
MKFNKLIAICVVFFLISSCSKDHELLPFSSTQLDPAIDFKGIHLTSSGKIYVSGGNPEFGVIYESIDNGLTWKDKQTYFDKWINDIWINDQSDGICIDQDVLIYRSTNEGDSWKQYFPEEWPLSVTRNLRDVIQIDSSSYFICGGKNFSNGLVYSSKNHGVDWEFEEFNHELRVIYFNDPLNGVTVGYGTVLHTSNGGDSWTIIDTYREFYTGITGDKSQKYWSCGFNGGLYLSNNNGVSWDRIKKSNKTFSNRDRFTCIQRHTSGKIVACGVDGLIAISSDNGSSWRFYESFMGKTINDVMVISNVKAIAVADDGYIFSVNI